MRSLTVPARVGSGPAETLDIALSEDMPPRVERPSDPYNLRGSQRN